jgi:hypothetical protein
MGDSQVIAFTLAAAALTIAPGADNMLVIRNVLRGGRRDGMVTASGICAGLFVHATLSACGVSMLLMHSATAFHLVKLAGACYLVWLGVQSLKSRHQHGVMVFWSPWRGPPCSRIMVPSSQESHAWLGKVAHEACARTTIHVVPRRVS